LELLSIYSIKCKNNEISHPPPAKSTMRIDFMPSLTLSKLKSDSKTPELLAIDEMSSSPSIIDTDVLSVLGNLKMDLEDKLLDFTKEDCGIPENACVQRKQLVAKITLKKVFIFEVCLDLSLLLTQIAA